ncbi:virulence factor TspB C-terminal domain-related protein [Acinetobacter baumannii]|uniref:virulence factor TspB C-terminal domain-related protein n=1 Tax=Acinetobacter baumannii TaxID=470 RepID=UPI001D19768C|nr:virulence factor TspB C-terminal domain-related protein [Acinetobacter baumannii]
MVHRFNIFLLSLLLIFSQIIVINQAIASTVASEGWNVSKRLIQGATTFYDGAKNVVLNGKNYAATGAAAITPTAAQVSKMIVRTGAVLAVDLAIKALIGAVGYTMDPANNRVIYRVPPDPNSPNLQYAWHWTNIGYYSTPTEAAVAYMAYHNSTASSSKQAASYQIKDTISANSKTVNLFDSSGALVGLATIQWLLNPNYDPKAPPQENQEKYLPYDAVAAQLISDAMADKSDGKAYVSSVADTALEDEQTQIIPADQVIDQLNQSQAIPTSNTATGSATPTTGSGTGDPTAQPAPTDITLNFPVFCSWAPTVCQAAQTVISFPKTLSNWWETGSKAVSEAWTSTKEWMNADDTPADPTEVEIEDPKVDVPNTNYFNWGAYCPFTPGAQTISLGDTSASIDYDLSSWCELASDLRPFVLAAGALMSFLIAAGIVMGRDD